MDWALPSLVILAGLIAALLVGVPIAFALGGISLLGIIVFIDPSALSAISNITWGASNEFILTAVPLFLLMSEVILFTGIGADLFSTMEKWFGRLPGGLAVGSVISCAIFGAVSGTGVGVAAIVGGIAVPEMLKRGYKEEMATGSVASASAIGMVIPPSLPFIIYGVVTQTSVGDLFIAGILPGLMLTGFYALYIIWSSRKDKNLNLISYTWKEKFKSLLSVTPVLILIIITIGSIYAGLATPTEAAGVGAFGSLVIAAAYRRLNRQNLKSALAKAARGSSMVLLITMGAMLFGYLLTSLQIPQALSTWVISIGVSRWVVFAILMIAYIFLGMFLEAVSVILITMPIVYPIITALHFDPIWFAVVLIINMCIAVVTPPVGLCTYVVKGVAPQVSISTIVRGTIPFLLLDVAAILLLVFFPQIALVLVQ